MFLLPPFAPSRYHDQVLKGCRTQGTRLTTPVVHMSRHHAVTELAEMGHSDQTIMSIAGHVGREMLDHYSHIRITAKRRALEALETPIPDPQASLPLESVPDTVN